jgi:CDGSH-type Zn-finger protein/uncharacterized Fe-S cluster protein YjdI
MAGKIFEYPGANISIQYDAKRCIHAAECAHGLPAVFDPQRKPWVDANGASPDEIVAVVARCPTGALHYTRHDGGPAEAVPAQNTIAVEANGPLLLRGDLAIMGTDGAVALTDTRLALCRCGASANKPFCDGSHSKAGFQDGGVLGNHGVRTVATDMPESGLRITPGANGPLGLKGTVELHSADGQVCQSGNRLFLCRCGASANKPFCDGSHSTVGFTAG